MSFNLPLTSQSVKLLELKDKPDYNTKWWFCMLSDSTLFSNSKSAYTLVRLLKLCNGNSYNDQI
jgi:hypothetical protein